MIKIDKKTIEHILKNFRFNDESRPPTNYSRRKVFMALSNLRPKEVAIIYYTLQAKIAPNNETARALNISTISLNNYYTSINKKLSYLGIKNKRDILSFFSGIVGAEKRIKEFSEIFAVELVSFEKRFGRGRVDLNKIMGNWNLSHFEREILYSIHCLHDPTTDKIAQFMGEKNPKITKALGKIYSKFYAHGLKDKATLSNAIKQLGADNPIFKTARDKYMTTNA